MIRSLTVLSACLAILAASSAASAEEAAVTPKHRVSAALGSAFTFFEPGDDGHYTRSGFGAGLRLGYAYRAASYAELGAGVTYFRVGHGDGPDTFLTAASIRLHADLGAGFELGLTARAGVCVLRLFDMPGPGNTTPTSNVVWVGPTYSLAPDIRTMIGPQTAFIVSPDLTVGGGDVDPARVKSTYLRESAGFGQLGFWLGVVHAL